MTSEIERIHLLDFVRGVAIIGMVTHHAAYILTVFYNVDISFLSTKVFEVIRTIFALAFIITAGISTNLSRRPKLNGLKVSGAALVVTLATFLVTPEIL